MKTKSKSSSTRGLSAQAILSDYLRQEGLKLTLKQRQALLDDPKKLVALGNAMRLAGRKLLFAQCIAAARKALKADPVDFDTAKDTLGAAKKLDKKHPDVGAVEAEIAEAEKRQQFSNCIATAHACLVSVDGPDYEGTKKWLDKALVLYPGDPAIMELQEAINKKRFEVYIAKAKELLSGDQGPDLNDARGYLMRARELFAEAPDVAEVEKLAREVEQKVLEFLRHTDAVMDALRATPIRIGDAREEVERAAAIFANHPALKARREQIEEAEKALEASRSSVVVGVSDEKDGPNVSEDSTLGAPHSDLPDPSQAPVSGQPEKFDGNPFD